MAAPLIHSTHVRIDTLEDLTMMCQTLTDCLGGTSIFTRVSSQNLLGSQYGWDVSIHDAIRTWGSTGQFSGVLFNASNEFGPIDGTVENRLFYTHLYSSSGSGLAAVAPVSGGYGYMFFLFSGTTDRAGECRGWSVGGSDSVPTLFAPTPTSFICVDAAFNGTAVATGTGAPDLTHIDVTGYDPTDIRNAGFAYLNGSDYSGTISMLGYYDEYTIYSGEKIEPANFSYLYAKTLSEYHYAMAIGDGEQYRARLAIHIGHSALGSVPTYFRALNGSLNFATRPVSRTYPLVRPFHGPDNKLGLTFKPLAGDIIIFENYQISSGTPWHLRANISVGAEIDFINTVIQNAGGTEDDCALGSDVTISGGLIDKCGVVAVNGATISGTTISNPANGPAVEITTASNLDNIKFSSDRSSMAHRAIRIPDPAGATVSYNFNSLTFEDFLYDVLVEGTTGTVNLNILGGGDTPIIDKGTLVNEIPVLLDSWTDGATKTAGTGGGDGLRMLIVVVSNNGNKIPDGVTFGGVAMNLAHSITEDPIGGSIWYLHESSNGGVFSGSQSISASWSGGTPSEVVFQSATYDHLRSSQIIDVKDSANTSEGDSVDVSVINDWTSTDEVDSATVNPGAGSNRLGIVVVNHEDNNQSSGVTGITWGGQAMTELLQEDTGYNGVQIFYILEAGIALMSGGVVSTDGYIGSNPDSACLGVALFGNVDQTTPFRDYGSAANSPGDITNLAINNGDMIVATFATSGNYPPTWTGEIATPDSSFDISPTSSTDTSAGAYKTYTGTDTTTATAGTTSGGGARAATGIAILKAGGSVSGNNGATVTAQDDGLAIALAATYHPSGTLWGITFGGDVTERDEVDGTTMRMGVADYIESAGPADISATMTDTDGTADAAAILAVVTFIPHSNTVGGPTVNVNAAVTLSVTGMETGARVRIEHQGSGVLIAEGVGSGGSFSDSYNFTGNTAVDVVVRQKGYIPIRQPATITSTGMSVQVVMVEDIIVS